MPYFNTSQPTPSSKNSINSIATDYGLRDFLLQRNLKPVYPLAMGMLPSPKIGEPVLDTMVNTGSNQIPNGLPLEIEGIFNKELAVIQNQFKNTDSTNNDLTVIEFQQKTQGPWGNVDYPKGTSPYPRTSTDESFNYGLMGKTNKVGYRDKIGLKNLYFDKDLQIDSADWIALQTGDITENIKNYTDEFGRLKAVDLLGSIISGQGVGVSKTGLIANFDIKASLAGRVLSASGVINDTKLGMIGGEQLLFSLANNAAFNIQQEILGGVNAQDNILSLVKNGTLAGFRPNYQITRYSNALNNVLDTGARILGFTLPKSSLDDSGSIFQTENGNSENIDRANSMILNTGKGQVVALLTQANANLNGIASDTSDSPKNSVFRSGYAPGYSDTKGVKQIEGNNIYAFSKEGHIIQLLKPINGVIPELSINRTEMIENSGFKDFSGFGPLAGQSYTESNIKKPGFTWSTPVGLNVSGKYNPDGSYAEPAFDEYVGDKKSLLTKTQALFNDIGMKSIISTKGDMSIKTPNQLQTAVVGGGISRGNAVMKASSFTKDGYYDGSQKTAEETYCRSWTTTSRYDKLNSLVRSSGLNGKVPYRSGNGFKATESVLDDNGFPKISPYSTDSQADPKKFMLSIENLAWNDRVTDLLPSEQGPGDLVTGKKGRIMWFPPYDITFNENSSVNWESNNFIGRGEPIYTYNNTERSGTLSFKVIVDHPSYINSFSSSKGSVVDDHYVNSFWAGCIDPAKEFSDKLTVNEKNAIETNFVTSSDKKTITVETPPPSFNVYFPNDNATIPPLYENGLSGISSTQHIDYDVYDSGYGIGPYPRKFTEGNTGFWNDNHNYGLNAGIVRNGGDLVVIDGISYSGWTDPLLLSGISKYLDEKCPNCVVTVKGYASAQGNITSNTELSKSRATYILNILKGELFTSLSGPDKEKRFKTEIGGEIAGGTSVNDCLAKDIKNANGVIITEAITDTKPCKLNRKTTVSFVFSSELQQESLNLNKNNDKKTELRTQTRVNTKISNRFYDEQYYFEKLKENDPFVFDSFREKIKYFHPAFHSTTPEGLNSRLTFLLQCTRQGPTSELLGANNLVFGRPPVCILRIGDFYNTKIVMDTVAISYEPLVWDLNPEGVGVQPMIANVDISFKFIGGSTLAGPINKLQNALSFNYFANAQVYDARADYIAKDPYQETRTNNNGKEIPKYDIVNGYKNINEFGETKISTFTGPTVDVNQELEELTLPVNQEQPDIVISDVTITGINCDSSKTVKTSISWELLVKLDIINGSNNPNADATTLSKYGMYYSLRITDINSNETYQASLDIFTLEFALTPNGSIASFIIPIKKSNTTTGITDSFGRENFNLEILANNSKIANMNYKLS